MMDEKRCRELAFEIAPSWPFRAQDIERVLVYLASRRVDQTDLDSPPLLTDAWIREALPILLRTDITLGFGVPGNSAYHAVELARRAPKGPLEESQDA